VAVATVAALLLVPLGGCSSPTEGSLEAGAVGPRKGGVLRMVREAPRSLDPADADSVYESFPINQIFDGLVSIDPGLRVTPGLASTWTLSRDGLTYTFSLRPGVRFHDGTPLTADDVVFTFQRLMAPDREWRGGARSHLSVIEGAEAFTRGESDDLTGVYALDGNTIRVRLTRPCLSFLDVLAMDGLKIVPRRLVETMSQEEFARRPVGTGPFRLADWNEEKIRLEASEEYFGGRPHLDAVEIYARGPLEEAGGEERFFRGEVDVVDVTSDSLERLVQDPAVRVYRYQELNLAFLGLCARHGPLADPRVRRAIGQAIDRPAIVAESPATRREALGILPPGIPGYSPASKGLRHDPAEAARLLEEAGYPGGQGLPALEVYTTATGGAVQRLLESIGRDLEGVGIALEVRHVSWREMSQRIDRREAPAFLLGWIADLADPDAFLRSLFESGGAANYFELADPVTDALLEKGSRETNPLARAELYRRLEAHVLDLAPMVPLYHTVGLLAMRPEVHGLEPGPLGLACARMESVWLADRERGR
jgi:peptide/nickel transport system substrate-binding protein/oligopeptide transport system substrate-binding protein